MHGKFAQPEMQAPENGRRLGRFGEHLKALASISPEPLVPTPRHTPRT